jgi:hypothetical protein
MLWFKGIEKFRIFCHSIIVVDFLMLILLLCYRCGGGGGDNVNFMFYTQCNGTDSFFNTFILVYSLSLEKAMGGSD